MPSISKPNTTYLLLFFLILMTLTSCEEETLKDYNEPNQVLKRINFTIADAEHLYENDKNLKQTIEKIKNNMQKATSSSIYNFGIYESSIQVLEATNYTQYTFEVYRDTSISGQLENYVLLIYHDNSVEQYLVKYNTNADNTFDFYDIQTISDPDLDITKSSCTPELIEQQDFTTCTSYPCGGDGHIVGEECDCEISADCTRAYVECVDGTVYVFEDPCGGQSTDGNPTTPDPSSPQEPTSSNGPGIGTNDTNDPSNPSDETITIKPYTKVSQCTRDAINNLPQDQADWINSLDDCEPVALGETSTCNRNLYEDIASFINSNSNDCEMSVEDELLLEEFKEIIETVPNAKIERLKELKDLIEEDPWALIQDCAQQNGMAISNYQNLYNHGIPQSCITRLDNLGDDYSNQPISDGNVPCLI